MNSELHLLAAVNASISAGNAIMEIYSKPFSVDIKPDNSPVTEADKKAQAIITEALLFTGIPLISEEADAEDFQARQAWGYCWIVDPLDGTKEFIKKNDEFTVNIAMVEKGKPVLGVIYVPAKKNLYFGSVGNGSLKLHLDSVFHFDNMELLKHKARPIKDSSVTSSKYILAVSRSHMNDRTQDYIDFLKKTKKREIQLKPAGSSEKFMLVAEGYVSEYPRFGTTMEWDTAAAHAILNAEGHKVYEYGTAQELQYNKADLRNPDFIAV
jgi:3'(2'), 5'-bisphosphate nucleotidase